MTSPYSVQHLRNTYPGNEAAFRKALEQAVLAAHEKAKKAAAVVASPQASHGPALNQDGNGQTRSFPGGRSYPGQQQAPMQQPTPTTNINANVNNVNAQQSSQGMTYIPYARDTAPQARPSSFQSVPRRQNQPLSRDQHQQQQQQQQQGSGSSSMNMNVGGSSLGPSIATRPGQMPRHSSSAHNPTTIRQPKIQPLPVTTSREALPPYFPVSTSQAYMTTYPSRLKLGLTSLIQPISSSGQVVSANPRAITSTASRAVQAESSTNTLGKRQRAKVDYTERLRVIGREESSEDEDDSSEEDDDDNTQEDSKLSRAQRAAKRSGIPVPFQSTVSTPRDSPAPDNSRSKKRKDKTKDDIGGGGRTWLGQDPPGDLISVQPAKRHILPYM